MDEVVARTNIQAQREVAQRIVRTGRNDRRQRITVSLVLLTDRQRHIVSATAWDVLGPTGLFDDVLFFLVPWQPLDLLRARRAVRTLQASRMYYLTPMPRTRWQAARDGLFFGRLCGTRDIVGLKATASYPIRDAAGRLVTLERESDRLVRWVMGDAAPAAGRDPPWR